MYFIYVMRQEDKDKMIQLGYRLFKEDKANNVYVFNAKHHTDDMMFSDGEVELSNTGISYVLSNVLTF